MIRPQHPPEVEALRQNHPQPLEWLVDQHARHGDIFTTRVDGAPTVVCGGATGTSAFFAAERHHLSVYNTPLVHDLFGRSVFNLPRDQHPTARRLVQSGLNAEFLRGKADTVATIAAEHHKTWRHGVIDLYAAARHLTMDVCGQLIVGVQPGSSQEAALVRAFEAFVRGTEVPSSSRHASTTYWRARRARIDLTQLFRERLEASEHGSRASVLAFIAAHAARRGLSVADVPDHLLALLIAARETTASLMVWLLVELATDDTLAESVVDDAEGLVAEPAAVLAAGTAPALRATMLEAERLHSPNGLSLRSADADIEVGGFHVPRGWRVAYSPAANHLIAGLWPEPHRFRPDRFTGTEARLAAELLTFGRGPHRCPGRHLAEMVVLLVAAATVPRSQLVLPDGRPRVASYLPVRAPARPLRARLVARSRP